MIIKGGTRAGGADLGVHLSRTDTNERVLLLELRGVAGMNLDQALREMEAFGAGTRCKSPLYHANIDPRADERLTPEQWGRAVDALEAKLGFTGQPRALVQHVKEGREHVHVVWSRIDLERNRAIPDSHNYRKHEEVARALEREFGHERVQGAHVERDGKERPARTPSHAEMQQAERSGLDPKAIKAEITALWRQTDSGKAFAGALAEAGYILARGDRRDFIVIDQAGESHSLARRIDGAKAADIRARLSDIDQAAL
ncbi:relaxase/mobilization nuclease domain-containing protein, partial [Acidiphilium sp. PM]|uniref:relaxase/mobilization nuclease domain-containing protein n=1 Tax=Acidiphilium sp. PM TaxID=1043206 RepID=UPI0002144B24